MTVDRGDTCESSDIEFTALVEGGALNVLLEDVGPFRVATVIVDASLDLYQLTLDRNASATICVFTRFQDP